MAWGLMVGYFQMIMGIVWWWKGRFDHHFFIDTWGGHPWGGHDSSAGRKCSYPKALQAGSDTWYRRRDSEILENLGDPEGFCRRCILLKTASLACLSCQVRLACLQTIRVTIVHLAAAQGSATKRAGIDKSAGQMGEQYLIMDIAIIAIAWWLAAVKYPELGRVSTVSTVPANHERGLQASQHFWLLAGGNWQWH
jgi:hypothetical protein